MALAIDLNFSTPMRLDGPGSCLKNHKNGLPHNECELGQPCKVGTDNDYAMFLTTRYLDPNPNDNGKPFDPNHLSRCSVCVGAD